VLGAGAVQALNDAIRKHLPSHDIGRRGRSYAMRNLLSRVPAVGELARRRSLRELSRTSDHRFFFVAWRDGLGCGME